MIPDKIYLVEDNGGLFDEWYVEEFDFGTKNHCYIRKDFLLKRLTHAKEFREKHCSDPNKVADYTAPINALIDLINSL